MGLDMWRLQTEVGWSDPVIVMLSRTAGLGIG
jgi:hypothetical protein